MMGWPGPVTHRQFRAWSRWYRLEYDNPTRSDLYVAYVACEVIRSRARNPGSVKFSDVLDVLKWNRDENGMSEEVTDPKLACEMSKSHWLAFMGSSSSIPVVHKTVDPGEKPYAPIAVEQPRRNGRK